MRSAPNVATSKISLVEVARTLKRADPAADALQEAEGLLDGFLLIDVDNGVVREAAQLSAGLRALDAIHLASALTIRAESMLVYDVQLAGAARAAGVAIVT